MYYTHAYNFRHESPRLPVQDTKNPHTVPFNRIDVGIFIHQTSAFSHQQSSLLLFPSSPLGETERGSLLLILIFPSILLHQFLKFSKLLYPLRLHLPSIKDLPIRLQPIEHIMLLNPMLRRIPMIDLYKVNHLIIPRYPPIILRHTKC